MTQKRYGQAGPRAFVRRIGHERALHASSGPVLSLYFPDPAHGSPTLMDQAQALAAFANRFVRKEFRERFLHEAAQKPGDLHRRICHRIEEVFDASYKDRAASFQARDRCFFLGWSSPMTVASWAEAKASIDRGGGGYLVIRSDGAAFYAEAEGYPARTYAGGG